MLSATKGIIDRHCLDMNYLQLDELGAINNAETANLEICWVNQKGCSLWEIMTLMMTSVDGSDCSVAGRL